MKLIIAEKPSVAMSIAKVVGAKVKKEGYIEGRDYIASWCVGHLVSMANPEAYDEKYGKWNIEDLPIFPRDYIYQISPKTKKQFNVLKKLLNDKRVDTVINGADAGREGELIFRLVYTMAKSKKPIKRLWISSMEDEAIKEGLDNLKDGSYYENLYESALARAKADWLVGMNLSRLYSKLYNIGYSVGRVQTPTLNMIVTRDSEIRDFKKEKYYTVELNLGEFSLKTDRIDDLDVANQLLNLVDETVSIIKVIREEKKTSPDLPFDLTTLQRECNKYFGYSAKQTLDYAQSLYEKKLITYPRTDSRHLTNDMVVSVTNSFLHSMKDFDSSRTKVVFNGGKVTDHHAIIPTVSSLTIDKDTLQESERRVYELIYDKFIASFSMPFIQSITKVEFDFDSFSFKTQGTEIIDKGFTKYLEKYKKSKENIIPTVKGGQEFRILDRKINGNYTKPPKNYTEDTLLKAMENAGKEYLDKDVEIERSGLGTPATRAGIIENLIAKGLVKREKKNLVPTQKGISLITIVNDNIKSTKMTSTWEMKLSKIASGDYEGYQFIKEIEQEILDIIKPYKELKNA